MLEILTVCTGNVCRSPLAAQVLSGLLADLQVKISSAGTHAHDGSKMPPEALRRAAEHGVPHSRAADHTAHFLTPSNLASVDLVLAMARDHRRHVVEMEPSLIRKTFLLREIHRLTVDLDDRLLTSVAAEAHPAHAPTRLGALLVLVASRRGIVAAPTYSAEVDDVVDPFGRSAKTYDLSARQIVSSLSSVERLIRIASSEQQIP